MNIKMVRRKLEKNALYTTVTDELKVRPHYICANNWILVKNILSEFKTCCVDQIFIESELITIYNTMTFAMENLEEISTSLELIECKEYIFGFMRHYLKLSIKLEKYETSQNINDLLELFTVKCLSSPKYDF